MKFSIKHFLGILAFIIPVTIWAQDKKEIRSIDDIPRFSYKIDDKASAVYQDKEKFDILYKQVKNDYSQLLEEYSFKDKTLRKDILNTLKQIDFYENNLSNAEEKTMASPNVVNLAAKLMAINPELSVNETIELIKAGCDRSSDGKINLINTQKSIALLTSPNNN